MWSLFALTVLAEVAVLYLPGFFILKAIRWKTLTSIAVAPLVSIALSESLSIVYAKAGIFTSAFTLFLPLLFFSVLVFVVCTLRRRASAAAQNNKHAYKSSMSDAAIMLLYVVVALLIASFYFVEPLNGATSFSQESDNTAHLGYIQSFLASGNYSMLDASFYHDIAVSGESPNGSSTGGFYPAAWHCVAALAGSLVGAPATVAANAALFVFVVCVFPLSMYLFLSYITGNKRVVVACGSVVTLGFAAFPWGMITFGPLYPNMAAFSCVPLAVYLFMGFLDSLKGSETKRVDFLIIFLVGLFALASLQPNAVFTVGVLSIVFCLKAVYEVTAERKNAVRVILVGSCALLILVVWVALYKLPFLQSVVSFVWDPITSARQAVVNNFFLSYVNTSAQLFLAALVVAGCLYCFAKRNNRWVVGTYALTCFLVFIAAFSSGSLRSLFIGFWYTDCYRVAAMAAIAGIPLAAYGLYALFRIIQKAWAWCTRSCGITKGDLSKGGIFCFFVVATLLIYYPSFSIPGITAVNTPFGDFQARWHDENHSVNICILNEDEEKFLQNVQAIVPDESTIINVPDDGSVFGYGAYDLDVYYRRTGASAISHETEESKLIRLHLAEYAYNEDVQSAVTNSNAKYLLVLDQGEDPNGERYWFGHYNSEEWVGIDAVNDNTPGFKVVLAKGDMRLYEIEPVS